MKTIILLAISLFSLSAMAQQNVVLRSGEIVRIQCQDSSILKQVSSGTKIAAFTCVNACVATLKTHTSFLGKNYCANVEIGKRTIHTTCTNKAYWDKSEVADLANEAIERALANGECDDVKRIGF